MIYRFEDFELDTAHSRLLRGGKIQNIEPQVYSLIDILISNNHRIVSKQEIVDYVWRDRNTSNASIDTRIRSARQAIADNGQDQLLIRTFKNQGFRFVGTVISTDVDQPFAQKILHMLTKKSKILVGIILITLIAFGFAIHTLMNGTGQVSTSALAGAETDSQTSSIAVLPFKDISASNDQSHLSNGFTEELMNSLMLIDGLKVSSRTSVDIFTDKRLPIEDVASILKVAHIVEGSLRREGEILRISVRLIDAETGRPLWNKVYDRTLKSANIFEIQNDIARNVAGNLSKRLDLSDVKQLTQTTVLEAYENYLIGKKLQKEGTAKSLKASLKAFQDALKIDGQFAPAYTGLFRNYYLMNRMGMVSDPEALTAMKRNLRSAEDIAPGSPEVLRAAGILADWNDRPEEAMRLFTELVALAPNYGDGHTSLGVTLKVLGRFDEALEAYETALKIDPLSPVLLSNLSFLKLSLGDLQGAFETTQINMRWNADDLEVQSEMAYLHWLQGDYAIAHHLYLKILKKNPEDYTAQNYLSRIYQDIGREDLAIRIASHQNIKAITLAFAGNFENARVIASKDPSDPDLAFALHLTGRDEYLLQNIREDMEAYKMLDPNKKIAVDDYYYLSSMAFVLQRNDDPKAGKLLARLDQYFIERPLVHYRTFKEFQAGIAYFLMRDDPANALKCLDEAIDRGFAMLQLTREPMFALLEKQAGYEKRRARMKENALRHRQSISEQIANQEDK